MNHIYRKVWSARLGAFVAVSEIARAAGSGTRGATLVAAALLGLGGPAQAQAQLAPGALPTGGQLSAGQARIATQDNAMTVTQTSARAAIHWQGFNIGANASVRFDQPNASSVLLNRVVGNERSVIEGALSANGQVFLLNPNGVYFGSGSRVDVGALLASTRDLSDSDFLAGRITLSGSSAGAVDNRGQIHAADGGYVALIGRSVLNDGMVSARLGTVAAAAGDRVSLNFNGNSLVGVSVDRGTLQALVANGGAMRADGGQILLTARAAESLVDAVVNNTGELRARTIEQRDGRIVLQADMAQGQAQVGGTLDASAPDGGRAGFIETSGARVNVRPDARVTTLASSGQTGQWLLDPTDLSIDNGNGLQTGSSIGASTLANSLASTNVQLVTGASGNDAGDIRVLSPVTWNAPTRLTLSAHGSIVIGADISAQHANGQLQLDFGQGAVAAGNTAHYRLSNGARVHLQAGDNFFTRLGSDGALDGWRVITQLGSAGSTTGTDLQGIAGRLDGRYVLGTDIDARATSTWNSGAGFEPLGIWGNGFTGRFDGLGHSISGLRIQRPERDHVGLFGFGDGGTIGRVRLNNANIVGGSAVGALVGGGNNGLAIDDAHASGTVNGLTSVGGVVGAVAGQVRGSSSSATVSGGDNIGGVVGYLEGAIENSTASGPVSGTNTVGGLAGQATHIRASSASGAVNASGYNVGGLVGYATSVSDSSASGQVRTDGGGAGGLVGSGGSISGSTASGAVSGLEYVGGLAGYLTGQIDNSSASGNATATGDYAGGLAGQADTITGSWASGQVSGRNYVGGLAGVILTSVTGVTGVTTARGNVSGAFSVGGLAGQAGSISNASASGHVNATGNNVGGLVGVATEVTNASASGEVTAEGSFVGGLAGYVFNRISGSTASGRVTGSESVGGLAGVTTTVTGSTASGAVHASGNNVGGLVGTADTVSDSSASGQVITAGDFVGGLAGYANSMIGSWASGHVSGKDYVGGLAGWVNGAITGLEGVTTARGNVSGASSVGGLAGLANSISNASAMGTVNATGNNVGGLVGQATEVMNSSASGQVTASGNAVGGLAGYVYQRISNSTASGVVNGRDYVGGLVGHLVGDVDHSSASGQVSGVGSLIGGLVGWGNNITDASASGDVSGDSYVGGLAGQVGQRITRGQASGHVLATGSTVGGLVGAATEVVDSKATGRVTATGSVVGGLAGWAQDVSGSEASGDVSGGWMVGGLVGQAAGKVTTSKASGDVNGQGSYVGGLVGYGDGDLSLSSATGAVSGGEYVGGLTGQANTITGSWASGQVSGSNYVGGLAGIVLSSVTGVTGVTTARGNVSGASSVGGLAGQANSISNASAMGKVNATGNNVGGLVGLVTDVTDSSASGAVNASGYNVGGLAGFVNNRISSSTASGRVSGFESVGGLAGVATTVTGSAASGAVHASGNNVGGLVGYAGTVSDSSASGQVITAGDLAGGLVGQADTISASRASGDVSGANYVGGLAGWVHSAITGVDGVTTARGNVSGTSYVGGLAGHVGNISNASAMGTVNATGNNVGGLVGEATEVMNSSATGAVSGKDNVGGLVGYIQGDVVQSSASGQVSGGTYVGGLAGYVGQRIIRGQASGKVSATDYNAGGLAGYAAEVEDSSASGDVNGSYTVGGLAGQAITINRSSASGDVNGTYTVGGLVGQAATITNSWASGKVSSSSYTSGGLAGVATEVKDSWASGDVSGSDTVGGLVGIASTITNSTASGNVSGTSAVGGLAGVLGYSRSEVRNSWFSGSVSGSREVGGLVGRLDWYAPSVINSHYNLDAVRILIDGVDQSAQVTLGGLYAPQYDAWTAGGRVALNPANYFKADAEGRWQLESAADLKNMLAFASDASQSFRLTRNIDISNTPGWRLPVLAGSLDGGYHTIDGLQNLQPWNSYQGLIGTLSGQVRRLGVTGTVRGAEYVGGLAGVVTGSIDESYASMDVSGSYYVGGLAGYLTENGALTNSYADGTVRGLRTLSEWDQPTGIGSLVGVSEGRLDRSYGAATVICTDCYAAGGMVGAAFPPTTRSFAIVSRTGINNWEDNVEYPSGETLLDDIAARQTATWADAGWSISSAPGSNATWRIYEGLSLPLLRGFLTPLSISGSAFKVYDGTSTLTAPTLRASGALDATHLLGTATGTASSSRPGAQAMTLSGLYSDQQGYDIDYGASQAIITTPELPGQAEAAGAAWRAGREAVQTSPPPLRQAEGAPLTEVPAELTEAFPTGTSLGVVGAPSTGQTARAVHLRTASRLTGQGNQGTTRLPVGRALPLNMIDGGLRLPPQVDQLVFVVKE